MRKLTFISIWLGLILFLFVSCEESYKPVLDVVPSTLVVESLVTNDTVQNFVRLSMSRDFYSTSPVVWITGAHVELIEEKGGNIQGTEVKTGYYTFTDIPVTGKKYQLRISVQQDIFESEFIVMPPVPSIDSLYTKYKIEKKFKINGYGVPELFDIPGREIYIDAPISSQLAYHRFNYRAIIQWIYIPWLTFDSIPPLIIPEPIPPKPVPPSDVPNSRTKQASILSAVVPPPADRDTSLHVLYGWITWTNLDLFNLAGPKEFSVSEKLISHPIVSLAYNNENYVDSILQHPRNWIIILDQYGIPKESYDFHKKLNQQFSAEGSLFDPMLTQVFGNIYCKNDPSKIALGYFNLNSYKQYRYYLNLGTGDESTVIQRRLFRFYDIPERGYTKDLPPVFWENNY